ncbi:malonate--CoA ligase-like [Brassica napus]|uniref:malonate--CoA ligase-like n=1 Tax=Brassica napus TaxID=3708 RepID=UPI002078B10C|nr:malonate--CoA ligase-like [Brassica napus]
MSDSLKGRSEKYRNFTSDRVAIKANGKSYSYGQLTSSALTISKLFHKEDTKNGGETRKYGGFSSLQGARVGIVAKPSAEFVAGVLGTWFSGGVAVPLALSYILRLNSYMS